MDLKCLSCDNSNESKLLDIHATPEIIEKLNFVSCLNFELNGVYRLCKQCDSELNISYEFKKRCQSIHSSLISEFSNDYWNESSQMDDKDEPIDFNDYLNEILIPETCLEELAINDDIIEKKEQVFTEEALEVNENTCRFCFIEFNSPEQVANHIISHENEVQPYRCPECNSRFKTKGYRRDHFRIHSKICPYQCRFCEISFKSTSNRSRHEMKHHPHQKRELKKSEEMNVKSISKVVQTKSPIQVTRKGIKMYSCSFCEKSFLRHDNLKRHEAIHSDARNFKCTECEKAFKTSEMMRSHLKIHFKNYSCTDCDKKFNSSRSLETHQRTHQGIRPFTCNISKCGKDYTSKKGLREHQRKHHAKQPIPQAIPIKVNTKSKRQTARKPK
ncbi:unnamed protein product [Diamesa hyperborea]